MQSITNTLDDLKDKYSGNKEVVHNLENKVHQGEKMLPDHEQNLKKYIWDKKKRSNLRFTVIDEGIEFQNKK